MKTNIGLLFIIIIFGVVIWGQAMIIFVQAGENAGLKATPVATCPTPIVTAEQLEQAGYNLDKLIQHSFKQE